MPKTMKLPCDLTDADRLRIGETLTSEIKAREQVEAAKKAAVRDFNVALKAHRAQEHDLNESLFTGKELREVDIEERPDYVAGIVFIHRLDTGDCVQQRAIDPDERQVKMGLDGPTVLEGGKAAERAEEQTAESPEEAEAMRAERLANERAERISAGATEARERISLVSEGEDATAWKATLQYGNRVLEAEAATAEAAADGVVQQVVEILEAQEDEAAKPTWEDVAAASKAEQDRQEVERLAAEQAADDAKTNGKGKRGFKKGLVAPKRKSKHPVELPDGRTVDPEVEAAAIDAAEVPTDADGKPLAF